MEEIQKPNSNAFFGKTEVDEASNSPLVICQAMWNKKGEEANTFDINKY